MTRIIPSITALVVVATLSLASCGSDSPGSVICDSQTSPNASAAGLCRVWTGSTFNTYKQVCSQEGGTEVASCTADNRVGLCATKQGFGITLDYVYYSPKYTEASARQHCEHLAACSYLCQFTP